MNMVEVNGVNYTISNAEVAQFLNEYVYTDMIMDEEMDAITPADDCFALLCEAINDEPMFAESLLEFLNE